MVITNNLIFFIFIEATEEEIEEVVVEASVVTEEVAVEVVVAAIAVDLSHRQEPNQKK